MKKIMWIILAGIFLMQSSGTSLRAAMDVPDARPIIEKMLHNYYYSNSDGRSHAMMEITSRNGQKRNRDFVILRKNIPDSLNQFYYVYFYEPTDVRGVVFLVHKQNQRDDDRWLYLPAIDLVRRISANDKRSSFVGSDFTYEDVSGRRLSDDEYEYVGEEAFQSFGKVADRTAIIIKAIPKERGAVEFSYRMIWVDKEYLLPLKVEHYNKRNEMYKVFEALHIEIIQETPTIIKGIMKDLENKSQTIMEFKEVEYDLGIDDDIFTERYLRRPPGEWIK